MIGVRYPFTIANGMVATVSNPAEIALSQVTFCISTQVLERVMRPSWGIELMNVAQALGADVPEIIDEAVHEAFRNWFATYQIKQIRVSQKDDTTVLVDIRYGRPDTDSDDAARIGVPVPGGSEIFLGERSS